MMIPIWCVAAFLSIYKRIKNPDPPKQHPPIRKGEGFRVQGAGVKGAGHRSGVRNRYEKA
ncbi:hypothetical protein N9Z66_00090 [bacterium]|nr:hypothetical protein [bacterium]